MYFGRLVVVMRALLVRLSIENVLDSKKNGFWLWCFASFPNEPHHVVYVVDIDIRTDWSSTSDFKRSRLVKAIAPNDVVPVLLGLRLSVHRFSFKIKVF